MPKSCSKCGTHYIGLECPGCLRARVKKLENALRHIAGSSEGHAKRVADAALAECPEVPRG